MKFRNWGRDYDRWKMQRRQRRHDYVTKWHPHFCLFPVDLIDGRIAWLELVERKYWYTGYPGNACPYMWIYRVP